MEENSTKGSLLQRCHFWLAKLPTWRLLKASRSFMGDINKGLSCAGSPPFQKVPGPREILRLCCGVGGLEASGWTHMAWAGLGSPGAHR